MADQEEKIATFISISGSDADFARSFLEGNGWDLEKASSAFLEGGGGGTGGGGGGLAAASSSSAGGALGAGTDDAIARIMQDHGVSETDARAIAAAQAPAGDDGVRAPIARTQGRLFEAQPFGAYPGTSSAASSSVSFRDFERESRRMEAEKRQRLEANKAGLGTSSAVFGSGKPVTVASGMDVDDTYNYDYSSEDEADDGIGAEVGALAAQRERNLQTLFEPPRELLFVGTFEAARAQAREQKRWILVNIQKDSEFFSYVLNRDLWQSELIKDILSSSFLFFQHDFNDQEAQLYTRFYKPTKFPHLAIIDPRTGEQVLNMDLKSRANESNPDDLRSSFLDKVSTFLDRNSMAAAPAPAAAAPPAAPAPASPAPAPAAAPAAATAAAATESSGQALGSSESSPSGANAPAGAVEYEPLEDEPAADAENVTQVRIRLFNGKVANRRFLTTQSVGQIFSLVRSLVPETEARPFDLVVAGVPPKPLAGHKKSTLADEGLARAAVSAKWL